MLTPANGNRCLVQILGQMPSYLGYCGVDVFAVTVSLRAKIEKIASFQGVFSWFDLTFVNFQYLDVCATVFQAYLAIRVQFPVHCASLKLSFQISQAVFH